MWEFRNLTASCSHSQLLDERWSARMNHFCKLLFWDQTAHPTPRGGEVLRKKKRNFNRLSLTAIYSWKLWHDELSVVPKKPSLSTFHSFHGGGSSNTMMNSLELTANYQTLFHTCPNSDHYDHIHLHQPPMRPHSSTWVSNSFLTLLWNKNMTLWFHSSLLIKPCISWWICFFQSCVTFFSVDSFCWWKKLTPAPPFTMYKTL